MNGPAATEDLPPDGDRGCRRRPTLKKAWADLLGRDDAGHPLPYRCGSAHWLKVGLPSAIDRLTRHGDHVVSRSFHGRWQRWFMQAHSFVPTVVMLLAIVVSALGPALRHRGWEVLAIVALTMAGYWAALRWWLGPRARGQGHGLLTLQFLLLTLLCALLFWHTGLDSPEARSRPYSNLFAPAIVLLMAVAAVGHVGAWWVMRGFADGDRRLLAGLLARTELFVDPEPPEPSPHRYLHGFVNAPLYHPLHLLLLPALPVVAVPADWVHMVGLSGLACAWLLLTFSGMYDRLSLMIKVVRQYFLIGGQLVVSLLIIGLAVARVAEVGYVTTLLDTASAGVILSYVLAAYGALWLYEHWLNRALSERILPLLQPAPGTPARLAWVPWPIEPGAVASRVHAQGRAVELFAGGRFVVTGVYDDAHSGSRCGQWLPLERSELFERLARAAARQVTVLTPRDVYRSRVAAAEIDKRAKLYFNAMNVLLVGVVAGTAWGLHLTLRPDAVATGTRLDATSAARQPVSLVERVFEREGGTRPAVLLAASGGGTRAALYTASVLRGLAAVGRIDDVVLVSGVSGGSAALAYFAQHHAVLRASAPGPCDAAAIDAIERSPPDEGDPWCRFVVTMAQPFIDDVLRGLSQADVAGRASTGHLLAQSFVRRFGPATEGATVADVRRVGLILNTTLAGHPAADSALLDGWWGGRAAGPRDAYAVLAGGRLVVTNVQEVGAFPAAATAAADEPDARLPFVVAAGRGIALGAAAALSANFPPVFSNVAVDLHDPAAPGTPPRRYWVTDGGAADNRGIESLQYALRSLLQDCERSLRCRGTPPPIHLVVADASALAIDYRADRGGAALLGAASRFASQLMLENFDHDRQRYAQALGGRLSLHHLPMPAVLRVRGGLGTHWSMPRSATLRDLCAVDKARAEEIQVPRRELMSMIAALHDPPPSAPAPIGPACLASRDQGAPGAAQWLSRDRHAAHWAALVHALGDAGGAPR